MNETTKTTPKDFFLHLSATLALYVSAGALINLLFSVINYYFPDQLAGYFYANAVAWPISMLIILIPTLYVLEYLINRDITKVPEKVSTRWYKSGRYHAMMSAAEPPELLPIVARPSGSLVNVTL